MIKSIDGKTINYRVVKRQSMRTSFSVRTVDRMSIAEGSRANQTSVSNHGSMVYHHFLFTTSTNWCFTRTDIVFISLGLLGTTVFYSSFHRWHHSKNHILRQDTSKQINPRITRLRFLTHCKTLSYFYAWKSNNPDTSECQFTRRKKSNKTKQLVRNSVD